MMIDAVAGAVVDGDNNDIVIKFVIVVVVVVVVVSVVVGLYGWGAHVGGAIHHILIVHGGGEWRSCCSSFPYNYSFSVHTHDVAVLPSSEWNIINNNVAELNEDIERRDEALQKLAEYQLDYCNPHVQPPSPIEMYAFRDELSVPPSPPPLARSIDSPVGHRLLAPSPSAGCCPATSEKVAWIGNGNIIHRLFHAVWSRFSGEWMWHLYISKNICLLFCSCEINFSAIC